jgi:hypothetical protein
MPDSNSRKPPLPIALSFLACLDIFRDDRTKAAILVGPTSHVPVRQFPAHVRVSIFAEMTGCHGSYEPQLCLLDNDDQTVWAWKGKVPVQHNDPLLPHQVTFHDLTLAVPHAGRYRLALLFNGDEFVQRSMWVGPAEAFIG